MHALLAWILDRVFRGIKIHKPSGEYLDRWFLWGGDPEDGGPPRVRWCLHRIVSDDYDRDPHGHPWPFRTWVLWGGYTDEVWRLVNGRLLGPFYDELRVGDTRRQELPHIHRIRYLRGVTWTLVKMGPREQHWGYYLPDGTWVYWRRYLGLPCPKGVPQSPTDAVV